MGRAAAPIGPLPELELAQPRIAIAPTLGGFPVTAEVRAAVEMLAQQLSAGGAAVEEAKLPELDVTQDLLRAADLIGMMIGGFQRPAGY